MTGTPITRRAPGRPPMLRASPPGPIAMPDRCSASGPWWRSRWRSSCCSSSSTQRRLPGASGDAALAARAGGRACSPCWPTRPDVPVRASSRTTGWVWPATWLPSSVARSSSGPPWRSPPVRRRPLAAAARPRRRRDVAPDGRRRRTRRAAPARHAVRLLADHRRPLRRHGQPRLRAARWSPPSWWPPAPGRSGPASAWRPTRVPAPGSDRAARGSPPPASPSASSSTACPSFGADVGGVLALLPALAVTWLLLAGVRVGVAKLAVVVGAAVVAVVAFAAYDLSPPGRPPDPPRALRPAGARRRRRHHHRAQAQLEPPRARQRRA